MIVLGHVERSLMASSGSLTVLRLEKKASQLIVCLQDGISTPSIRTPETRTQRTSYYPKEEIELFKLECGEHELYIQSDVRKGSESFPAVGREGGEVFQPVAGS